jgi:hypothetical protein
MSGTWKRVVPEPATPAEQEPAGLSLSVEEALKLSERAAATVWAATVYLPSLQRHEARTALSQLHEQRTVLAQQLEQAEQRIKELERALEAALDCRGPFEGTVSKRGGAPAICTKCEELVRDVLREDSDEG